MSRRELYPVTIVRTRYGGTYEGGPWAAFFCDPSAVPDEAFGSDPECADWWFEAEAGRVEIQDWRARSMSRPGQRTSLRRLYVAVGESESMALDALEALVPAEGDPV